MLFPWQLHLTGKWVLGIIFPMFLGPGSRLRRTAPFRRAFRLAALVPRRDVLEPLPSAFLIFHGFILVGPFHLNSDRIPTCTMLGQVCLLRLKRQ